MERISIDDLEILFGKVPLQGPLLTPALYYPGRGKIIKKLEIKKKQEFLDSINNAAKELQERRKRSTSRLG